MPEETYEQRHDRILAEIYKQPIIKLPDEAWAGVDKALSEMDWDLFWFWEDGDNKTQDDIDAESLGLPLLDYYRMVAKHRGLLDD